MTLTAAEKQEVNSYELFIGALSVISIINIVLALVVFDPAVRNVILIVDTGLCFVFFADFWDACATPRARAATSFASWAGWTCLAACPSLACASPVSSVSPVSSGWCARWE